MCFAQYSIARRDLYHSNRVVIHPDYVGIGLGIRLTTTASQIMHEKGYTVWAKFTSPAMYRSRLGHPRWKYKDTKTITMKKQNSTFGSSATKDKDWSKRAASRNSAKLWGVKYYWFEYVPTATVDRAPVAGVEMPDQGTP